MIKKTMQTISVFNMPKKGFTFGVKEKVGVYHVFDARSDFQVLERKLPQEKFDDKETADLLEEVLKESEASYHRVGNSFEIFDPEHEEYEDIELPLYRKGKGYLDFTYIGTTYTVKHVPTLQMVKWSFEYYRRLIREMARTSLLGEIEFMIDCASLDGVSTIVETKYEVTPEFLKSDEYYLFCIERPYGWQRKYKTLIIKKAKAKWLAVDGVLPLSVPREVAGIVIGKGGRCTKEMAKELGMKYIQVKGY